MTFEFLMLQMVPNLFVRVPVWRVCRQVEHVESRLGFDVARSLLGYMGWRLIHHHHQMTPRMMPQHLSEKVYDFSRRNALVVQPEYQLAAARDRRHGRYRPSLARDPLLGRLP